MPFVLVSTTTGDELIPPEKNNVLVSDDRQALEAERERRAAYREKWLETHQYEISGPQLNSIIDHETIEEVPALTGGTTAGKS